MKTTPNVQRCSFYPNIAGVGLIHLTLSDSPGEDVTTPMVDLHVNADAVLALFYPAVKAAVELLANQVVPLILSQGNVLILNNGKIVDPSYAICVWNKVDYNSELKGSRVAFAKKTVAKMQARGLGFWSCSGKGFPENSTGCPDNLQGPVQNWETPFACLCDFAAGVTTVTHQKMLEGICIKVACHKNWAPLTKGKLGPLWSVPELLRVLL